MYNVVEMARKLKAKMRGGCAAGGSGDYAGGDSSVQVPKTLLWVLAILIIVGLAVYFFWPSSVPAVATMPLQQPQPIVIQVPQREVANGGMPT